MCIARRILKQAMFNRNRFEISDYLNSIVNATDRVEDWAGDTSSWSFKDGSMIICESHNYEIIK